MTDRYTNVAIAPRGTAIHAARKLAYVSDQPNNALLIIDIDKRAVVKKIDLGESPEGVYISHDGKLVTASVELANSVAFIDTATDAVAFRVRIKGENPEHAVFSPDGRFVYVSAEEDDKLEVIDVAARSLVAQLKVGTRPRGIAFTPDGAKAYVACERADTVYVLDARQHKILGTIMAGLRSNGLAMHPDGKRLYLSNGGDANVMVIDTGEDKVIATIPVGRRPWNMALTRDGAKLYVANGRSDSVSVIDTAKNVRIKDIPVGKTPWGVRTAVAVLAWAASTCVLAQEDAVVVTATRVDQPSLEIPASIDRLYGEDLREGRAQVNLSESLGRVPGIVVLNRQNYAQDLQISSRGFGARAAFGVRGIRMIADGIPASMPDGQGQSATFDLGSASRIEVLRGPFSSLYGNASGGVINVITEEPPPVPTLEAGLAAGSYGTLRGAFKFGAKRGDIGSLVNLSHFESDGYRDHSAVRRDQLNAKLKLSLGQDTGLTVVGMALHQPETQDPLGLNAVQVAANPRQATSVAHDFNTRKSIDHDQVGVTLDHRLSGASRLQASAWGGTRDVVQYLGIPLGAQAAVTHSGGVVDLDRGFGGLALRWFRDARLGERPLRLSAGVEYERMEERRRGYLNNNGTAGALKRDEDNVVASTGAYAQGEWRFTERWSAHAGLRASRVEFETTDYFIVPASANGDDSGAVDFSATTPVAGLVFRVDPQTSLYANYGRGFETPTFVELAYRNVGSGLNFNLVPARSRHVEAGVKAVRPGLARVNAAVFNIETRDEIVVDVSSGGRSTFRNAGRTERRGLEIGAESLLSGPFEARAAYTWLDAVYADDFGTTAAGNQLPGVPKEQFYAEGAWRHAPLGLRVALELLHRARVPVNDQNSEFAPSFTVVNAVVGFEQRGAGWRVSEFLRVDNVGDEAYIGSVIVNDGNGRYYEPAPRRNILLGVQAKLQF